MNCRVTIDRGPGKCDHFDGVIVGETSLGFFVAHRSNPVGEWFARSAPRQPDGTVAVHVTVFKNGN